MEVSNLEDKTANLSPNVRHQIPSETTLYPENGYFKISYVKTGNVRA